MRDLVPCVSGRRNLRTCLASRSARSSDLAHAMNGVQAQRCLSRRRCPVYRPLRHLVRLPSILPQPSREGADFDLNLRFGPTSQRPRREKTMTSSPAAVRKLNSCSAIAAGDVDLGPLRLALAQTLTHRWTSFAATHSSGLESSPATAQARELACPSLGSGRELLRRAASRYGIAEPFWFRPSP